MLTEDSGVLCFLSLEAATGLWVSVPNSIVSPWCQLPEGCRTHNWDNRGNSPGTGWPGVTVSPREVLPSMMWFVAMLQKFAEMLDILVCFVAGCL